MGPQLHFSMNSLSTILLKPRRGFFFFFLMNYGWARGLGLYCVPVSTGSKRRNLRIFLCVIVIWFWFLGIVPRDYVPMSGWKLSYPEWPFVCTVHNCTFIFACHCNSSTIYGTIHQQVQSPVYSLLERTLTFWFLAYFIFVLCYTTYNIIILSIGKQTVLFSRGILSFF